MAIEPQITMEAYLSVSTKMLLAFGIVFELPVLVLFLSWAHLITYQTLLKRWRGALVLCLLIGAILTPPDVITQLMLFVPLYALYLLSIGIAWIFGARPARQTQADAD
jgi:sec-independent protein translocase protein TatC